MICHTHIVKWGLSVDPSPFLMSWRWENMKKIAFLCLMATIGRNTCPLVVFSGYYQSPGPPLFGDARGMVSVHHHGHQNGQQNLCIVAYFHCHWHHGGCRGNTEQIVPQLRRPVAFGIALDILNQKMCFILHRRTAITIKMAGRQGALFPTVGFCYQP